MTTPTVHQPACPRCGYDLSGAVDTWTIQCPLRGVCPECGLDHRWRDVLNPGFAIPKWFVENRNARIRYALPVTGARCVRPRAFWSAIWMTHPFVGLRLALFAGALIAAGLLGVYALTVVFTDFDMAEMLRHQPLAVFDPFSLLAYAYEKSSSWVWMVTLWAALTPPAMLALIHTRRLARVRGVHLVRSGVYSIPLIMAVLIMNSSIRAVSEFRFPDRERGWWVRMTIPAWEADIWDLVAVIEGYLLIVVVGGLLVWYWNAVTHRYMRLSQPRVTAAIMLVVSGLASLAVVEVMGEGAIFFDMMMLLGDSGVLD